MKAEVNRNKIRTPQDFLDAVEAVIDRGEYGNHMYLVEHDKPIVVRSEDSMDIKVEDIVATPVRALKWDYLVGEDLIKYRRFILADHKFALYLIEIFSRPVDLFTSHFFEFKEQVFPHLIKMHNLKIENLEKKLEVGVTYRDQVLSAGELYVEVYNGFEKDKFISKIFKKISKK